VAALLLAAASGAWAEGAAEPERSAPDVKGLDGLSVGALWYLSYQYTDDANQTVIKRGYVDIKKKVLKWGANGLEARITPDVHQDETGDVKMRVKYAYGKFSWKSVSWEPWLEAGLVHMPWLDFEEHVNLFRMQDTMFIERNKTFNSADFGVTFGGFLGPKLDGPKHYPGRYGSFAVGVYNGGGYHAAEQNENKVLEGRLTLRPLPDRLPGLQLSYFGVVGKGNTDVSPDYSVNMGMLSYESSRGVLTATYYAGKGNNGGSAVDAEGQALSRKGFSVFGELRIPSAKRLSLIGRYDAFDPDDSVADDENQRLIAGVACDLGHHNTLLLDYDRVSYSSDKADDNRVQLTLQIKY